MQPTMEQCKSCPMWLGAGQIHTLCQQWAMGQTPETKKGCERLVLEEMPLLQQWEEIVLLRGEESDQVPPVRMLTLGRMSGGPRQLGDGCGWYQVAGAEETSVSTRAVVLEWKKEDGWTAWSECETFRTATVWRAGDGQTTKLLGRGLGTRLENGDVIELHKPSGELVCRMRFVSELRYEKEIGERMLQELDEQRFRKVLLLGGLCRFYRSQGWMV